MNFRIQGMLLALVMASASSVVVSAKPEGPTAVTLESLLLMRVDTTVVLDPQGTLLEFTVKSALDPALKAALERSAAKWRFSRTSSKPAYGNASEDLRVVLSAIKVGDRFHYRIDSLGLLNAPDGQADSASEPPPIALRSTPGTSYPGDYWPVTARVLLAICVSADGKAEHVQAVQSVLSNVRGSPSSLANAIGAFERSAVAAAQIWTFRIAPDRAALPEGDRTGLVTVTFTGDGVGNFDSVGVWYAVRRNPRRPIEWAAEKNGGRQVTDFAKGELAPLRGPIAVEIQPADRDLQ